MMDYSEWCRDIAEGCTLINGLECQHPVTARLRCAYIGCPKRPDLIPNLEAEIRWLEDQIAWRKRSIEALRKGVL